MNKKPSKNLHLLIVEARFYEEFSEALLEGAKVVLQQAGASYEVITVPGALEVPAVIAFAEKSKIFFDGYIALGCVIRGETHHFDIVANESCRGLNDLSIHYKLAIGNGILTVENKGQAWERTHMQKRDKGGFAAKAALEMIAIKKKLGVG
ncbi:MAG: dimethyl-8-ribityllumazine synthase [Candidatus Tokpelaia sp. JSC189]|nr:MAG: dimethyl-8-ribityllumazine synthase [Candidatus Tokpelaia sp. JSC189]